MGYRSLLFPLLVGATLAVVGGCRVERETHECYTDADCEQAGWVCEANACVPDGDVIDDAGADVVDPTDAGPDVGALCGNGRLDGDEQCDDGERNSDTVADACRTSCVHAGCGDGVVDSWEYCDPAMGEGVDGLCDPSTCQAFGEVCAWCADDMECTPGAFCDGGLCVDPDQACFDDEPCDEASYCRASMIVEGGFCVPLACGCEGCGEICYNDRDDDSDGAIDGADPDCWGALAATCGPVSEPQCAGDADCARLDPELVCVEGICRLGCDGSVACVDAYPNGHCDRSLGVPYCAGDSCPPVELADCVFDDDGWPQCELAACEPWCDDFCDFIDESTPDCRDMACVEQGYCGAEVCEVTPDGPDCWSEGCRWEPACVCDIVAPECGWPSCDVHAFCGGDCPMLEGVPDCGSLGCLGVSACSCDVAAPDCGNLNCHYLPECGGEVICEDGTEPDNDADDGLPLVGVAYPALCDVGDIDRFAGPLGGATQPFVINVLGPLERPWALNVEGMQIRGASADLSPMPETWPHAHGAQVVVRDASPTRGYEGGAAIWTTAAVPVFYRVAVVQADAQCPPDRYEPDNSYEQATVIPLRVMDDPKVSGLTVCPGDEDHFVIPAEHLGWGTLSVVNNAEALVHVVIADAEPRELRIPANGTGEFWVEGRDAHVIVWSDAVARNSMLEFRFVEAID